MKICVEVRHAFYMYVSVFIYLFHYPSIVHGSRCGAAVTRATRGRARPVNSSPAHGSRMGKASTRGNGPSPPRQVLRKKVRPSPCEGVVCVCVFGIRLD